MSDQIPMFVYRIVLLTYTNYNGFGELDSFTLYALSAEDAMRIGLEAYAEEWEYTQELVGTHGYDHIDISICVTLA